MRHAIENAPVIGDQARVSPGRVLDDQMLTWTGGRRREKFELVDFDPGQPEGDEIELLPTDGRTANPPWAPAWNA